MVDSCNERSGSLKARKLLNQLLLVKFELTKQEFYLLGYKAVKLYYCLSDKCYFIIGLCAAE
jgi:hypothetical protein